MQQQELESDLSVNVVLPGQIPSSDDGQALSQTSDEEEDFDMNTFRYGKQYKLKQQRKEQENEQLQRNSQELIVFLGSKFRVGNLKDRNKDPILLLNCTFSSFLAGSFTYYATFMLGQKFRLIPTLICIWGPLFFWLAVVEILGIPLKEHLKITRRIKLNIILFSFSAGGSIIYSYICHTPFNSVIYNFLGCFLSVFFFQFAGTLIMLPFKKPANDPIYQMRFFTSRILIGFFYATGVVDVLSDISLAIELFSNYNNYLLVLGILLLVVCFVDYAFLFQRIVFPTTITSFNYVLTVVVEILVIGLTIVVLIGVKKEESQQRENGNSDPLVLSVLSLTTTAVNFFHHIFVVFDWLMFKKQKDLSILF
eukprot:TRINITY_DN4466_c1_g1_i5.p1 TRINITY_DN4466_c1_g1~~TRINITY_DN4466_c1_g1_i5.p1  ORF type:complete len:366 (+),score=12.30 TRINITY_DN4466_c1_g1_i5:204-1301(+)